MDLFAVRNKKGDLHAYMHDRLLKNVGGGYWLPEYNTKTEELSLPREEFPNITWDNDKPTVLKLIDPNDVSAVPVLKNTIEIPVCDGFETNLPTGKYTIFVSKIDWIESQTGRTIIHLSNGEMVITKMPEEKIKELISKADV